MARKVNTKFVAISSIVTLLLLVGAFGLWRWRHKDPKMLIKRGDALLVEGKYEDAARHYATAASALKDPTLWVKAGDVYNKIAYDDRENLPKAMAMWDQAVGIDAGCMPALNRLLNIYLEYLELSESQQKGQLFDRIRDIAEKVLHNDPNNRQAKVVLPMLVVRAWLSGIETDPQKVDAALKELRDNQKEDPKNADVSYFIATTLMKKADLSANAVGAPTGEAL